MATAATSATAPATTATITSVATAVVPAIAERIAPLTTAATSSFLAAEGLASARLLTGFGHGCGEVEFMVFDGGNVFAQQPLDADKVA